MAGRHHVWQESDHQTGWAVVAGFLVGLGLIGLIMLSVAWTLAR